MASTLPICFLRLCGKSVFNDTRISECDIYVQLNREGSKYMHLSSLPDTECNDRELGTISDSRLLQCLQTLYVITGCDYTSFFHGIGKVAFLKTFYRQLQVGLVHVEC